ncbi:MAG: PAS domain-containing protein [Alphaproteobacteria bacterium]|nr:PAS domain-containing protein [Alphaproteobacteria bacterium]
MPLRSLEDIVAEPVREGHRYWRSLCDGERLPARANIDPADIPALLPYVVLSEVRRDPLTIAYRLVGTAVAELNGLDFTGYELNQGVEDPRWRSYWWRAYERAIGEGVPVFGADSYAYRDRSFVDFEWCLLPLASDGRRVDRLFEIEAGLSRPLAGAGAPRLVTQGAS